MPRKPALNKEDPEYQFLQGEKFFNHYLENGRSLDAAIRWHKRAADQLHGMACFRLGRIYSDWKFKRLDQMRAGMYLCIAFHLLKSEQEQKEIESVIEKLKDELNNEQLEEVVNWAGDMLDGKAFSWQYVYRFLETKFGNFKSLRIKSIADLKRLTQNELARRREHRSPCYPSKAPVRVIHDGSTVQIPRPTLLVDSREPVDFAYQFERFDNWFAGRKRKALSTGDYSLAEWAGEIAIERKTLDDLVASVMPPRRRQFLDCCERLSEYRRKAIVVEATMAQAKCFYEFSSAHPNAVVGSLFAIEERWGIPVIWAGNRDLAEEAVAHILSKYHALRWLEENNLPVHYVDGDI